MSIINCKMKKQNEMLLKAIMLDGQSLLIQKLHEDDSSVLT